MSYVGQMVRSGGSAAMKVISISDDGIAECVWIDGAGGIRRRWHEVDHLTPMWMSLGPKSLWPDITQLDLIAIEQEEQHARDERKATQKAAKKARRSNKIKRKVAA